MPDDPRKYMRLAMLLRARIAGGQLSRGQQLPTIAVIADEENVSRQTVSKALHVLARDGVIARVVGLGYFVQSGQPGTPPSNMHV